MKQGQRRPPIQLERDRREIARLYLRGELQSEIGDKLGLSQQTISNDLKVIQEQWKVDRGDDINERKNIELAKIDALEIEYWSAWIESLKDEQTKKAIKAGDKEIRQEMIVKGQSGNPAFLRGIEWCINKRCDLLGLDAPKKLENMNYDMSILPDEYLDRIAGGEDVGKVFAEFFGSLADKVIGSDE